MSGGVLDATYAHDRLQKPEVRFRYRIRARIVVEAVRRYLGRAEQVRVLDLGSAEGRALQELHAMLPNSTFCGVERSAELIAEAPSLPKSIQLYCGDVTALPGELEGPFDVVSALAVLEHLSAPQGAVREGAKVLRSGGSFGAAGPSPPWDHVAARLGAAHDDAHEVELDRGAMIALAEDAGLEVERVVKKRFATRLKKATVKKRFPSGAAQTRQQRSPSGSCCRAWATPFG